MEYVVGSVAALVSGNTTPSRPRGLKRSAATPVKHQPSPNITPKSELVNDRSIFLSPTTLKKKAIVKKSPKRIFQIPDLDVTDEKENLMSPKADKVKKHLTDELGGEGTSSRAKKLKKKHSDSQVPAETIQNEEAVPKKSKKRKVSDNSEAADKVEVSPSIKSNSEINQDYENKQTKKKNKKLKKKQNEGLKQNKSDTSTDNINIQESEENINSTLNEKKNKKLKKSKSKLVLPKGNETESVNNMQPENLEGSIRPDMGDNKKKNKKLKKFSSSERLSKKIKVNPNAITSKDTDSEHESDNAIASECDDKMDEILKNDKSASEDEEDETKSNNLKPKKQLLKEPTDTTEGEAVVHDPDEVNRTLFVGNVPFSKKCKKEIKKIFSIYGEIETVRIRSIPVKDPRFTPRLAAIRGELHPERSAVNVYVKFKRPDSVHQALAENGRELAGGRRARVSACAAGGAAPAHEAARAVFVGNVPFACSDDELRAAFAPCGAVRSVRLVRDHLAVGKGFGYVNFESKDSVELALALTPSQRTLGSRELRVQRCSLGRRDRQRLPGGPGYSPAPAQRHTGVRGRGHSGMRGHGQSGMRGRGHSGMRGHGQSGMRGRGQSGMRGHGQSGMRGRGMMRGSTSRHEDTQPEGPAPDRQGAFRRLEHKKKKSDSEFVGLTRDTKTKPKVKTSHKKKALAEIMSKP